MWLRRTLLLAFILLLPLLFWLLADVDSERGLVWLLFHQVYYAPLSWLGSPFFVPDGDLGFWAKWPGECWRQSCIWPSSSP
jgi:hypothetical protein